ncbi:DMT family transporter [Candidatus Saccharibacteria bacterium]|nr:MAG: DMT family transporter [Candidatus Saccharibacteria bacterium]
MWVIALVINLLLFVTSTLLRRRFAQSHTVPASVTLALSYVLGVMPLSLIAGVIAPHDIIWSYWTMWLLLSASLFVAAFIWLSFIAIRYLPAALNQTIFQTRIPITILLGWLFLGEGLSINQLIGAACILMSGIVAVWAPAKAHRQGRSTHKHLVKGVLFTLASAIFLGIGVVVEKAAIQYMDIGAFFIFGFGLQSLWLILFAFWDWRKHPGIQLSRQLLRESALLGIVVAGIGVSYFIALQGANNISLIAALSAVVLPLTAVAAHFVLHERDDDKLLWVAIGLAVIGVIITAL